MNAEDEITELKKRVELLEARFKRPVPSLKAERIAIELVMYRTKLLELLTAPGWMAGSRRDIDSIAAEPADQKV